MNMNVQSLYTYTVLHPKSLYGVSIRGVVFYVADENDDTTATSHGDNGKKTHQPWKFTSQQTMR